jgi:hypothetical protein
MFPRVGKKLHPHVIDYYKWNDQRINSIIKFQRVKKNYTPMPLTITYGITDGLTPLKSFKEVENNYTHMSLTTIDRIIDKLKMHR